MAQSYDAAITAPKSTFLNDIKFLKIFQVVKHVWHTLRESGIISEFSFFLLISMYEYFYNMLFF
jgi:hypothetical protein